MTNYGYAIYENYLLTISYNIDKFYSYDNSMNIKNPLYAKYYTGEFEIIEIENIENIYNNNIVNDDKILRKISNVTKYLDIWIDFWKTKEIPYNKLLYKYCVKKNKDKNICGYYKTYHDNGNIQVEFFHINGIKNGLFKEYYADGKLKEEIYYINGEKMLQN